MKTVQVATLLAALTLLIACDGSNGQLTIGADCGHPINQFCNKASGLICGSEFKCVCSSGPIATGLDYKLEWDAGQGKCLAQPDSPCFGTKQFPIPTGQNTAICTSNHECTDLKELPPGVGLCKTKTTFQSYGVTCNKDTFCDKAAGLICGDDLRCGCSKGPVSHELEYIFVWNTTVGKCLAAEGSACHTDKNVAVAQCGAELVCTQVEGTVPGVGICKTMEDTDDDDDDDECDHDDHDDHDHHCGSSGLIGLNSLFLAMSALFVLKL